MSVYRISPENIPEPGQFEVLEPLADDAVKDLLTEVAYLRTTFDVAGHSYGKEFRNSGVRTVQFAFEGEPTWVPPNYELLLSRRVASTEVPTIYEAYDGLMETVRRRPRGALGGGLVRINYVDPGNVYPRHKDGIPGTVMTTTLQGDRETHYWQPNGQSKTIIEQTPGARTIHRNGLPFMRQQPPHQVHVPSHNPVTAISLVFEAPL